VSPGFPTGKSPDQPMLITSDRRKQPHRIDRSKRVRFVHPPSVPSTPATTPELALAIADYIEHSYNTARRHSALGFLTPNDFEHLHSAKTPATSS